MSEILSALPNPGREYLKALASFNRKPGEDIRIPQLDFRVEGFAVSAQNLADYRQICGFEPQGGLPITYPHVLAAGLHLYMLTQPQFPLPLMGFVHLRNRITQTRALADDERLNVQVHTGASRQTDKGFEFDIMTRYRDADGAEVWTGETTILYRNRPAQSGPRKPPPAPDAYIASYSSLNAPADIGRRYGRIAGDMNPIHLYPLTAKLFGFPRHIAHGMWSMASCAARAIPQLGRIPRELSVQFKQPLLLPAKAAIKFSAQKEGLEYSLLGAGGSKMHLTGFIA